MKKIISILIALVLALSLTACGGSGGGEGTTNNPLKKSTLSKYVNEDALNSTDNISIVFDEVENEAFVLNMNAPELLNGLKVSKYSRICNDNIRLRIFGKNTMPSRYLSHFTFKGYGEFKLEVCDATSIKDGETPVTVLIDDGNFLLTKRGGCYEIWAKDKEKAVLITVEGVSSEEYQTLYNTIKEHFTFARIGTKKVTKNDLVYNVLDLKNATVFGEDKSSSIVESWCFASDILYKEMEQNGLSLITAADLSGYVNEVFSQQHFESKDAGKDFTFDIVPASETGRTFETTDSDKEFTIGDLTIKPCGESSHSKGYNGFIIKTQSGMEYHCGILPNEYPDVIDYDTACEYLKKIIIAK